MQLSIPPNQISEIITFSSQILDCAHYCYEHEQQPPEGLIEEVIFIQARLGSMLAEFQDGYGYGLVSPDVIYQLRAYEEMASSILKALRPS